MFGMIKILDIKILATASHFKFTAKAIVDACSLWNQNLKLKKTVPFWNQSRQAPLYKQ